MGRPETSSVRKGEAKRSIVKATEFVETAKSSLGSNRWNAAGLSAIHAGISAADAALIAVTGLRSVAKDHGAVTELLAESAAGFTATQRRQLGGLLKLKNQVAYESRLLMEIEARQLVDHAVRLTRWAKRLVDEHVGA